MITGRQEEGIYQPLLAEFEQKLGRDFSEDERAVVRKWAEGQQQQLRNREGREHEGQKLTDVEKELNEELCSKFNTEELAVLFDCYVKLKQPENRVGREEERFTAGEPHVHSGPQQLRRRLGDLREQKDDFPGLTESQIHGGRIKKHTGTIVVVIALLFVVIAAILCSYHYIQYAGTRTKPSPVQFSNSFAQVQAAFPGQTPRFWMILRNRATAHLKNPNPKKPLVIMFTAGPSAHNVLECIARKLAQTLDPDHHGLGHINSVEYLKYSSLDDAKKILDEKLEQFLQKGRTVVVSNVDQLPVQSPLLFYDYCDNENAPFKQAAIIFTVRLPIEPDPSLEPAKAEGLVEKYLRETWGKQDYIRPDDIPPLVNRMADTVVMVKKESDETMKRICAT